LHRPLLLHLAYPRKPLSPAFGSHLIEIKARVIDGINCADIEEVVGKITYGLLNDQSSRGKL
jgi:hypothetical protein